MHRTALLAGDRGAVYCAEIVTARPTLPKPCSCLTQRGIGGRGEMRPYRRLSWASSCFRSSATESGSRPCVRPSNRALNASPSASLPKTAQMEMLSPDRRNLKFDGSHLRSSSHFRIAAYSRKVHWAHSDRNRLHARSSFMSSVEPRREGMH